MTRPSRATLRISGYGLHSLDIAQSFYDAKNMMEFGPDSQKDGLVYFEYSQLRAPDRRHCVWLYYAFPLSYRDIEKIMLYRGIEVTYEAIRKWCKKFAQEYANQIRRRRPEPTDKWHLDEVVITIKGQQYCLWRAVNTTGQVLDVLMPRHRDQRAANKFFRKLLKSTGFTPRVIITDQLRSYGATNKELIPGVEHRQHKKLNNRAENSHRPTRTRERRMGRFKSPEHAQRFLAAFEPIRGYFHPHQHKQSATEYRETMRQSLSDWRRFTRLSAIA
ncbi:MAG: IS6 family transposase [Cyanobacteria bacterium P01_C01_bin.120]